MAKSIISFNANDEVSLLIKDVKDKGENVTQYVNNCILEANKPKEKASVIPEIRNMRVIK